MTKAFTFNADSYIKEMERLNDAIVPICKMGLYDGARAALDAVLAEIDEIPDRRYTNSGMARGLTKSDKDDLRAGLGISRMRDVDGQVSVKIGFDGYGSHSTPTWPNGVPVAVIARAICRGTSWLEKYDFISKAIRQSRARIEEKIASRIDDQIQKTIGENNK